MLSRIINPNSGEIEINGKVSCLIELGAGFHPDMTGRENIYINASIFGLTAKEVDERLDDIIRFSELEEYIDNPVRTYSSGMYMRLAFAVAINVNADILLIDEILAVGDSSFQSKCFNKIQEIKREGTTIVIVSHSLEQIEKICDRSVWIENGKIREEGKVHEVQEHYLKFMEEESDERRRKEKKIRIENNKQTEDSEYARKQKRDLSCFDICEQAFEQAKREGNGDIVFSEIKILNNNGELQTSYIYGDEINMSMKYKVFSITEKVYFQIDLLNQDWQFCFGSNTKNNLQTIEKDGELTLRLDKNHLGNRKYYVHASILKEDGTVLDRLANIAVLQIKTAQQYGYGMCGMAITWLK